MTIQESLEQVIASTTERLKQAPQPELLEVYLKLLERAETGGEMREELRILTARVSQLEAELSFTKAVGGVKTLPRIPEDARPIR